MKKPETISSIAEKYVKENRLRSAEARSNVRRNFIATFTYLEINPKKVVDVDFDGVWVENSDEESGLEKIEI